MLPLIKDEGNDNRYYPDLTDVGNYVTVMTKFILLRVLWSKQLILLVTII
jgi:hypothetical protein